MEAQKNPGRSSAQVHDSWTGRELHSRVAVKNEDGDNCAAGEILISVVYAFQLTDSSFHTNTQGWIKALAVCLCNFKWHINQGVEVSQEAPHGACLKEDQPSPGVPLASIFDIIHLYTFHYQYVLLSCH